MPQSNEDYKQNQKLPIAKNEDVEYDAEFADEEDMEAGQRAEQADARQQS
ncbi:YfhD family protein [Paenibacillus doosanensis]|nr:YfhD family protein [Paenibacillus doosanensis]MCS7458506.1 YfhD family protein [Paenibacillus doosanensis]